MAKVGYFIDEEGVGNFKIFAPFCDSLAVELENTHERITLTKQQDSYFVGKTKPLPNGCLYKLVKNNTDYLPDPYSKYQPLDVHGASQIVEINKVKSEGWEGIGIEDAIIYELHLGTFTAEGTLQGAKKKLNYLQKLGINVIELMPINQFPGNRNWGYDGTYLFALNQYYGTYQDLKEFIEDAHKLGMAVILDVVYNHFGPEGNYSGMIAPFTKDASTPWGAAINFDGGWSIGIRDFYTENVRYWLSEIGFDGFRMDAVSLIFDTSPKHILSEINEIAKEIATKEHRKIIMIAEHLRNDSHITSKDGYKFDAQWVDDLNYAIYAYLTHETFRHYKDFGSIEDLIKALNKGFVYDGTKLNSVYNNYMGVDGSNIPPQALIVHIQDHDQIGNRPYGDRISATHGINKALLAVTIVFCSPYTPMIFMGEEYAENKPFLFFESFNDEHLIEAVKIGRKNEFSFEKNFTPKDPHDIKTFTDCKLNWQLPEDAQHGKVLELYKKLIALKKEQIIGEHSHSNVKVTFDSQNELLIIESSKSITLCNLGNNMLNIPNKFKSMNLLLSTNINEDNTETIDKLSAKIFSK